VTVVFGFCEMKHNVSAAFQQNPPHAKNGTSDETNQPHAKKWYF
jgi:hypothetical protein